MVGLEIAKLKINNKLHTLSYISLSIKRGLAALQTVLLNHSEGIEKVDYLYQTS